MTEEFKNMPFNKKIEHIWEYYKPHIFIPTIIILIAVSLFYNLVLNPAPKTYAGVAFYGDFVDDTQIQSLIEETTALIVPENINEEVVFHSFYDSDTDSTVSVYMADKFRTLFMSKELDILIANKSNFHDLVYNGYIVNLDEIFTNEFMEEHKNSLYYDQNVQDDTLRAYGIGIGSTSLLNDIKRLNNQEMYVGVARHTERTENAKNVILKLIS